MASLLETFFIMFESNADKLKRGEEDARRSTKDLETDLNATDRAGVAMGEHLVGTLKNVALGFAAAFGAHEIFNSIVETQELDANLGRVSKRLEIAVEDLDAWDKATVRAGGAQGELIQSLDFLNRGMADIATKGTSRLKPFFDELKIKVTDAPKHVRPLIDILLELSDRAVKMDAQPFAGIAEKLGLGPGLALLIRSGRRDILELLREIKEHGVATGESAARAEEYRLRLIDLNETFEGMSRRIGAVVIPIMAEFLRLAAKTIEYFAAHKTLVEGFFIGVATVVTTVYGPAMAEAALATLAATWPFLLLAAAIGVAVTAFAFLYDDIQNFLHGNASVIGELSKKWPWVGETIKAVIGGVASYIKWATGVIKASFDFMSAAGQLVFAALGAAVRVLERIFAGTGERLAAAFPFWAHVFRAVGYLATIVAKEIGQVWDWILDKVSRVAGFISGAAGLVRGAANWLNDDGAAAPGAHTARGVKSLAAAQAAIHLVNTTSPALAHRPPSVVHKTTTVTTGNINIYPPNGDPATIGRAVSSHIEKHLRHATDHFDDGVAA